MTHHMGKVGLEVRLKSQEVRLRLPGARDVNVQSSARKEGVVIARTAACEVSHGYCGF